MRIVRTFSLLLAMACIALGARAQSSGRNSPDEPARSGSIPPSGTASAATKPTDAAAVKTIAPVAATREEVEELRSEVAELKAVIKKLLDAKAPPDAPASIAAANAARPRNAVVSQPGAPPEIAAEPEPAEPAGLWQEKKDQKPAGPPVTAGWNGEHFYIKSADGQFQLQPYGYVQTDYRAYDGDGAPANTFLVRRGRFGFQGKYGSHFDFGILTDASATTGATVRDIYLNVNIRPEFQVQFGQFKVPFAQELAIGITNLDFVERGLQSLLYPSAASAFRGPGGVIHGDLYENRVQYWVGAFNGRGFNVNNVTSIPETDGRLRFYPWRKQKDSFFQGFAFGGGMSFSRTRGLSLETTPSQTITDAAYAYFPQFRTNGNVWRYNAEFTWVRNAWGIRGEYDQAFFDRTGVGTLQLGGLGFSDLPTVRFKGWDISASYLLTGEKKPENGTPRVKHALFGPETPGGGGKGWGAFELAFRFTGVQGKEPGICFSGGSPLNLNGPNCVPTGLFSPQQVAGFSQHTQEYTAGINWYLNYWVKYQVNFAVDRLLQPSTIGATPQNYFVALQRIQFRF